MSQTLYGDRVAYRTRALTVDNGEITWDINRKPRSTRVGTVFDNTQFVNIFACPDYEISAIRYVRAGRFDGAFKGLGVGATHIAQFEVYAAEDEIEVNEIMNIKDDDGLPELGCEE